MKTIPYISVTFSEITIPFNCLTSDNRRCVFPAVHEGQMMNQCNPDATGVIRCPLAVEPKSLQVTEWAKCQPDSCVFGKIYHLFLQIIWIDLGVQPSRKGQSSTVVCYAS